ncbi:MAG: MmcB family DNA repair protein [Geminicoccaceae bacterium]|nr:MmcB family DNA repair protein [Geminicoccaceae bacterium]
MEPRLHPIPPPDRAGEIRRGVCRLLVDHGLAPLAEVKLPNGRRADVMAIGRNGQVWIVEIKSCRTDFLTDVKWEEYLGYADRFLFAVDLDFPRAILPEAEGLILADRFGGEIAREPAVRPLPPARRKAVTLLHARTAAFRLHGLVE